MALMKTPSSFTFASPAGKHWIFNVHLLGVEIFFANAFTSTTFSGGDGEGGDVSGGEKIIDSFPRVHLACNLSVWCIHL